MSKAKHVFSLDMIQKWDHAGEKPEKVSAEFAITPNIAADILANHAKLNRQLSDDMVKTYRARMDNGAWTMTAQSIVFDWDGKLHDGYHRISAIAGGKNAVDVYVTLLEDPSTFQAYDRGKKRRPADDFHLAGGSGATKTKVMATAKRMILGSRADTKDPIVVDQVLPFALKHNNLINNILTIFRKYRVVGVNSGVTGAFCKACLEYGETLVSQHLHRLVTQSWTGDNDPLKRLHIKITTPRPKLNDTEIYPYAVSAIRSALEGKDVTKLYQSHDDFVVDDETDEKPAEVSDVTVKPKRVDRNKQHAVEEVAKTEVAETKVTVESDSKPIPRPQVQIKSDHPELLALVRENLAKSDVGYSINQVIVFLKAFIDKPIMTPNDFMDKFKFKRAKANEVLIKFANAGFLVRNGGGYRHSDTVAASIGKSS